jgi:hypothetical protein
MRGSYPDARLVPTNPDNVLKKAVIRQTVEVRWLKFGKDAIVEF